MLTINYKKCTGCYACQNICPKDCINLVEDSEGFRYPQIDTDKCVDCHLCEKVCPIDKDIKNRNISVETHAYAGYAIDKEVRSASATAGIAYLCGKYIIEEGGVVFGVVGDVLSAVIHTKATSIEELAPMRGSKYLQSEVGNVYRDVKAELQTGRQVLFTGTPCQIAGLYGYLGQQYDNLYTLDLICHGVPSPMVLKKYISELEAKMGSKLVAFYRDKDFMGWKPVHFTYVLENGKKVTQKGWENPYNHAFITNIITRKSCQYCDYAQIPRVADVTVGDYIGGNKAKMHDINNEGLSMITVNSKKGSKLIQKLKDEVSLIEYPIEEAVKEGEHLGRSPKANIFRRTYFTLIKHCSFDKVDRIIMPKNIVHKYVRRGYGCLCYIYEFFKKDSLLRK